MRRLVPAFALAALVGACGPQEPAAESPGAPAVGEAVTVTTPAGEVDVSEGATVIGGGRPDFVADYPGAEVETDMAAREPNSLGGMYVFKTADPVDRVLGFYRSRADAAGLSPQTNVESANSRVYIAKGDKGDMNLVVTPREGRTFVQITWSAPAG